MSRTGGGPSAGSWAIAYEGSQPPVLLVDEVDRADDEFEAFLLEILSDYSITVPE